MTTHDSIENAAQHQRTPRSRESRSATSRTVSQRPPMTFGQSKFNLPLSVVQKARDNGQEMGFVVYSRGNEEQRENYDEAVFRGWRPLRTSDYPELAPPEALSPFGKRQEETENLIRRGGQVAMVRDTETHQAEQEYYDAEKERQRHLAEMYKTDDLGRPRVLIDQRSRNR